MMHVCPYCEKTHMNPSYVKVEYGPDSYEFLGFQCPDCDSKWITRDELITGLIRVATETESETKPKESPEEDFSVAVQ